MHIFCVLLDAAKLSRVFVSQFITDCIDIVSEVLIIQQTRVSLGHSPCSATNFHYNSEPPADESTHS